MEVENMQIEAIVNATFVNIFSTLKKKVRFYSMVRDFTACHTKLQNFKLKLSFFF